MAQMKRIPRFRLKLIGYALLSLAAGVSLLVLSQLVKPAARAAATTQTTAPTDNNRSPSREEASAQNMGGLLLLFSTAAFILMVVFVGWIMVDIRNSRPAWKRQTKYPRRR